MPSRYTPDQLVVARMKELVDLRSSWHRAPWQVGTVVALREVVEATQGTWSGQLTSPEAMKDFVASASLQVARDHGLGPDPVRTRVTSLAAGLPSKVTGKAQADLASLEQMIERCKDGYLTRWADYIDARGIQGDEVEFIARLLVSYLADEGLHRSHLHGWLTNVKPDENLRSVIEHGQDMVTADRRDYELVLAFNGVSAKVAEALGDIRRQADYYPEVFEQTSNSDRFAAPREPSVALALTFTALDPHTAIAEAVNWAQKFVTRVSVGTDDHVRLEDLIVDTTTNKVRSAALDRRTIRIPSLQRNHLYTAMSGVEGIEPIDDAIALLAGQDDAFGPASIASTWAAVEGLLGQIGGKGTDAADRLADIVACSFPRAELTELARRWESHGSGTLASSIKEASSNSIKTELLLDYISNSGDPGFMRPADVAAVARVKQMISSPETVLRRVREYYKTTFRRLYYQRNFIMHAAKFNSVSLPSTNRIAPQLVASGIDRIVNAKFGPAAVTSIGLAARAANELGLLGRSGARSLHSLLD